ncbi:hypothetical protein FRC02_004373 [Tulasnella sp. 418]|nr:hypothetical protein FRC02_004373 [Tulasnella sp. 418]
MTLPSSCYLLTSTPSLWSTIVRPSRFTYLMRSMNVCKVTLAILYLATEDWLARSTINPEHAISGEKGSDYAPDVSGDQDRGSDDDIDEDDRQLGSSRETRRSTSTAKQQTTYSSTRACHGHAKPPQDDVVSPKIAALGQGSQLYDEPVMPLLPV